MSIDTQNEFEGIKQDFDDFIRNELPELMEDSEQLLLQMCWISYVRGCMRQIDIEIKRLEQLSLREELIGKKIAFIAKVAFIVLWLTWLLILIWEQY